jgi:predicted RNA methylase
MGFRTILEARKFAKQRGVDDVKAVEEAVELGVVKAARAAIDEAASPQDAFDHLVWIYTHQPVLRTRTSTSMRDQAYSTPIPLAYIASYLAGISHETSVYEPTAGNGALLIGANPKLVVANELNPERRANLEAQGFKTVLGADASDLNAKSAAFSANGGNRFDAVIANPPFGPVQENDASKVFDLSWMQKGYRTREVDHAIAFEALQTLKDDGRAVLIIGSVHPNKDRANSYRAKAKTEFFLTLFKNYNVTDHFTVDGKLYERQGAGWPVDVIVIDGRGVTDRSLPSVTPPPVLSSWGLQAGLDQGEEPRHPRSDQHAVADGRGASQRLRERRGDLEGVSSARASDTRVDAEGPYFIRNGEKERPFAAEQVDALALALDNMERGAGFIIGDQTGIGKGRVNAGIIRFAMEKGHIPIFVTKDAGALQGHLPRPDRHGHREYLGREPRILMTNASSACRSTTRAREVLKTGDVKEHNALLNDLAAAGRSATTTSSRRPTARCRPSGARARSGSGSSRRSPRTPSWLWTKPQRRRPEEDVQASEGRPSRRAPTAPSSRARSSTGEGRLLLVGDLRQAPGHDGPLPQDRHAAGGRSNEDELAEAIEAGGVPMQQVVASMLSQAGQYIRRERSFHGVSTTPSSRPSTRRSTTLLAVAGAHQRLLARPQGRNEADRRRAEGRGRAVGHDNAVGRPGATR